MANKVAVAHPSSPRPPIRLLVSVLLLGSLLAWWGTRDHRHLFGNLQRKPVAAATLSAPPNIQIESAVIARGYQINERQCAGCHEMSTRSTGPSYQEIVTFYLHESAGKADRSDLLTRLASAVVHPPPGWGNFAAGPAQSSLSLEDRVAVASWLASSFGREKYQSKGVGN